MSEERRLARVKWFNPKAGYGFLTDCENAADVFVHHTQVSAPSNVYRTLTEGEYVEYATTVDDKGKTLAQNVTGVRQGPLLCERKRPPRKGNHHDHDQDQQRGQQQSH
jgi:cold shock CspA family protein